MVVRGISIRLSVVVPVVVFFAESTVVLFCFPFFNVSVLGWLLFLVLHVYLRKHDVPLAAEVFNCLPA